MSYSSLNFRTFNELYESCVIDLKSFEEQGMIDPSQLVKVAQLCSYNLGLKLHKVKETIIEIDNGLGRLPDDFYVLKMAFLTGHYRITHRPEQPHGRVTEDHFIPDVPLQASMTNCPCWTVISLGAQSKITYCDGTMGEIYFPANPDGSAATTTICATAIQPNQNLTLIRGNGCWEYDGGFHCQPKPLDSCGRQQTGNCNQNKDPMAQSLIYSVCGGTNQVKVIENRCDGEVREYHEFEKLAIKKSKWTDPACMNTQMRCQASASIKDGFLYTSFQTGKVFISYLGALEDEDGNLLVLDQPIANEYYETQTKERILENLYYSGEDVLHKLQYAQKQSIAAKKAALDYVNMPDFNTIRSTYHANRRHMENKYMRPFHTSVFRRWGIDRFDLI